MEWMGSFDTETTDEPLGEIGEWNSSARSCGRTKSSKSDSRRQQIETDDYFGSSYNTWAQECPMLPVLSDVFSEAFPLENGNVLVTGKAARSCGRMKLSESESRRQQIETDDYFGSGYSMWAPEHPMFPVLSDVFSEAFLI